MADDDWSALVRRDFLRLGLGAGAAFLTGCEAPAPPLAKEEPPKAPPVDDDPIALMPEGKAEARFYGDELDRFHALLWDKAQGLRQLGGLPAAPAERVRVCIVGGGLSGLSCAWLLRDLKPVVLEGATRLGGNAKGQRWGDLAYSIGSAYITGEELDAPHMQMLATLGLTKKWRLDEPVHDKMVVRGSLYPNFWFGGTDPKRAADFVAAWKYFEGVRDSTFPDVPYAEDGQLSREDYVALDRRSFHDELRRALGKQLHPHVEDVVRQYCWSSFGADSKEISAAAGLNFLASDLGGMYVFPGGNSAISQALARAVRADCGQNALRSSSAVVDVRRQADGVHVTVAGPDGKLATIACDVCIVATPKFVAKKLIDDLPPAQLAAIEQLTYRSYVVGHVLIDQPHPADFHDQYLIAGEAPAGALRDELDRRPFTDVVLASFATNGHPTRTVLNLYRGMPFDGARAELVQPTSYDIWRRRIEPALPAILKTLELDPAKIVDLRLTRWGHPLIVPKVGMLTSGIPEAAAAPHAGRIFFAQQDNHVMSAFETGFAAASAAATSARKVLAG